MHFTPPNFEIGYGSASSVEKAIPSDCRQVTADNFDV